MEMLLYGGYIPVDSIYFSIDCYWLGLYVDPFKN